MSAEYLNSPPVTRSRRPGHRLLAGAVLLLVIVVLAGVVGLLQSSAQLAITPPPLYPGALSTADLGSDLTAYTTPDSYQQVLAHYRRGTAAQGTNVSEAHGYLFAGQVERLFLTPSPGDQEVQETLFIHRANRVTIWTLVARGRTASVTRIITGRRLDARPPRVRMTANRFLLDDWAHPPWGARDTAEVGGIVAGTCIIPAPFADYWRNHAAMAAVSRDYAPGLTSALAPPASANGGIRPGVYWSGDESDSLRLAVFERFEPGWCSLAILGAGPSQKSTRLFLVTLLN